MTLQRIGTEGEDHLRKCFGAALYVNDDAGEKAAREAAWLGPILVHPDDNEVRRCAASLVEKDGDPRGELMRLQGELATIAEHESRRNELTRRVNNLVAAHAKEWLAPLDDAIPWCFPRPRGMKINQFIGLRTARWPHYGFHRDMAEEMTTSAGNFATYAADLFHDVPTIRRACLHFRVDGAEGAQRLAACPYLTRLTALELHGLNDDLLGVLAQSRHLTHLRSLRLTGYLEDVAGLAGWMGSLRWRG